MAGNNNPGYAAILFSQRKSNIRLDFLLLNYHVVSKTVILKERI